MKFRKYTRFASIAIALMLMLSIFACYIPPQQTELGQSTMSGPLEIGNAGSASAPALFFNDDSDSGLYQSAANNFDFAIGGSQALNLSASGLDLVGSSLFDSTGAIAITDSLAPSGSSSLGSTTIDATAEITFTGPADGYYLGQTVAPAGDVNGDGYPDLIIGAPSADAAGSNRGQAYIYHGGPSMDNSADLTITGGADGDNLGHSIASAGDVNGDGYADVIVGAYHADTVAGNSGDAYIFYGGPSMDNTADVTFSGAVAGDYLGWDVASAGDVNGDGYSDVIVGAIYADGPGSNRGQAYIYHGGSSMDTTADVTLTGLVDTDQFGSSVASAGDVNGDGYSDVIVGAVDADAGGNRNGQAFIFHGGPSMDTTADVTFTGADTFVKLGYDVASAGDLNGDGYSDVIVGTNDNTAFIHHGGPLMDNTADVTLTGIDSGDALGRSVASAGDVNGDGYPDLIIGAQLAEQEGGNNRGEAYIFYGGPSMDTTADVTFYGIADLDYLGDAVASAGDVNGDGYTDVIVGAPRNDTNGNDRGQAYLHQSSGTSWQSIFADSAFIHKAIQVQSTRLTQWGLETTAPFGITTPNWNINRTGNAGLQDLTIGNTATIAGTLTHPDATNAGNVFALYGTHDHEDVETAVTMGVIPANANILDVSYTVGTDWDDSTSAAVDCGISGGDVDAYVDALNVNATGDNDVNRMGDAADMPSATALGDVGSSDITVICQVAEGTDDASAGSATLVIDYMVD